MTPPVTLIPSPKIKREPTAPAQVLATPVATRPEPNTPAPPPIPTVPSIGLSSNVVIVRALFESLFNVMVNVSGCPLDNTLLLNALETLNDDRTVILLVASPAAGIPKSLVKSPPLVILFVCTPVVYPPFVCEAITSTVKVQLPLAGISPVATTVSAPTTGVNDGVPLVQILDALAGFATSITALPPN